MDILLENAMKLLADLYLRFGYGRVERVYNYTNRKVRVIVQEEEDSLIGESLLGEYVVV